MFSGRCTLQSKDGDMKPHKKNMRKKLDLIIFKTNLWQKKIQTMSFSFPLYVPFLTMLKRKKKLATELCTKISVPQNTVPDLF